MGPDAASMPLVTECIFLRIFLKVYVQKYTFKNMLFEVVNVWCAWCSFDAVGDWVHWLSFSQPASSQ